MCFVLADTNQEKLNLVQANRKLVLTDLDVAVASEMINDHFGGLTLTKVYVYIFGCVGRVM